MQKITPFLWFDTQAEEAANFYVSLFKNSTVLNVNRFDDPVSGVAGKVLTVNFILDGQEYLALNGGPEFKFTEAISLFVHCEDQEEVDRLWENLSEGGMVQQCGWLRDKYGLSWQIIPIALMKLMGDPDPIKAGRVREAMLKMIKIDVRELEKAWEGG